MKFTVDSRDTKVLSDGLYAKMVNSRVIIALPERLYCKDIQKLLNVLLLVLPKIIENAFKEMKNPWYSPFFQKIKEQGADVEILRYLFSEKESLIVMPIKDDEKGIYCIEIWTEIK